jgi:zinc protease
MKCGASRESEGRRQKAEGSGQKRCRHRLPPSAVGRRPSAFCLLPSAFCLLFLATGLSSAAPPAAPPAPRVRPIIGPNGLRLLVKPNHSSEIVAITCLVRVGLPEEPEEHAGIAALLAETILRGTQTHPPALIAQAMASAGGTLRASAKFDFTELSMVTSRERLDDAIRMLGEVLREPSLDQESIDAVRELLIQRGQALDDDFAGSSSQTLLGELYRASPYGRPIYGYPSTLKAITRRDLERFYKRYYVQSNMHVAVVGDIDVNQASDAVLKTFGNLPQVPAPPRRVVAPEVLPAPRVRLAQKPGENLQVMVGFLVPPTSPANYPVLMVLDALLGGGKRARLFSNIREKHQIGYVLGSYYQPLRLQSHLVGYVITSPYRRNAVTGDTEPVADFARERLLEQFRDLAEKGPAEEEVARAKNYVIGRYALLHERNLDQAHWLAWSDAMRLGVEFDQELGSKISAVTKEQIQQAAKEHFKNYALVVTMPDSEEPGANP